MRTKRRRTNPAHPKNPAALPPEIEALGRDSSTPEEIEIHRRIAADPGFQCMMEEAERDIREGRTVPQDEVFAHAPRGIKRTPEEEREFERRHVEHWRARARVAR